MVFIPVQVLKGNFIVLFSLFISRANAEIAQVRSKAKQEQAAHQASLRKEQMKVDSLERTLEQKVSDEKHTNLKENTVPCQRLFISAERFTTSSMYFMRGLCLYCGLNKDMI